MPNILGRGIRMDVRARDASGKLYNVEVQRRNSGATPKRSRFNSALMDANYSVSGDDEQLKQLPESYVLFITRNDIFKRGKAIYHIERVVLETGELFGDEAHIIYINGAFDDISTKAGRLIHDFRCTDASKMFFSEFADRTRELKETREGREMMGDTMERFAAAYTAERIAKQVAEQVSVQVAEQVAAQVEQRMAS